MSKVMLSESYLEDIADAIRSKNGLTDTYKPSEMAEAISELGGATLGAKTITANDTYYASSDDLDGYSSVTVNVPNPSTGTINITSNGTVDVTQYASADVNVPSVTPTGTINITQNGTVDVTNYASASVAVPNPSTGTKQISITQNGTTTEDVTNYANAEITVAVPVNLTLIGEKTVSLSEYTNTSTWESTDTGINISNTDYALIVGTITCDSQITTSTEWGITVFVGGRYTSNGSFYFSGCVWQKGSSTLSKSAMVTNSVNSSVYGVVPQNNTANIKIERKAHGTGCPKIRAGNYTVKVYGVSAI